MKISNFIEELKRRNVFKVAVAYGIAGWLAIQVVDTVSPQLGFPDWVAPFITVVVLIAFPRALVIAWAFELTPDGLKKSDQVVPEKSIAPETGKKLNIIIIGILSFTIVFLLVERIFFVSPSVSPQNGNDMELATIAVLPFADMSPSNDQEYFSDGLSEELLNVLAKVEGIQVAGRTSSFQFKGQNQDLRYVGSQLGVNHILEGSVRKSGDRLRITAQLVRADNGFHIWSETYDRTYTAENIFDIQDEISRQVLRELKVRLLPREESAISKMPTNDTEAYEAYLMGNQLLVNRQPEEIEKALTHFKRATRLDPGFAEAYARLAIAYDLLYDFGNLNKEEALQLMRSNIDQALLLDSNLGLAYAALGHYYAKLLEDEKAEEAHRKAHELSPGDPELMVWYANNIDEAEKRRPLLIQAYDIDPLNPLTMLNRAGVHRALDEHDEALALAEKNKLLHPDFGLVYLQLTNILADVPFGRLDEAFVQAYQGYLREPDNPYNLIALNSTAHDLGFLPITEEVKKQFLQHYPENEYLYDIRYDHLMQSRDLHGLIQVVKDYEELYGIEKGHDALSYNYLRIFLHVDSLKAAGHYLDTYYPSLRSDTLTKVKPNRTGFTAAASIVYRRLGEDEIADRLANLVCMETKKLFEHNGDIQKEKLDTLFEYVKCTGVRGNVEMTTAIVEEYHFRRNSKSNIFFFIDVNPTYNLVRESHEFQQLRARIEQDIQSMRSNAIAWLKTEGYWKEEWNNE